MTAPGTRRSGPVALACAATVLAVGGIEMAAGPRAPGGAQMIAAQGIRADAVNTLRPAALSHDGRLIAFTARAGPVSQTHCCLAVFVLDRSSGHLTQESIGPGGTPLPGNSDAPSLSADGQTIAFESFSPALAPGDEPIAAVRIVARNRRTGRVWSPRGFRGSPPDGESREPVLSGDGRNVVFTSHATNLTSVTDANGNRSDVYLWRMEAPTVVRVSLSGTGAQSATGVSHSPSLSHDGELVAFVSTARLVPQDTNDLADVYLRDVGRGLTVLVSRTPDGGRGNGHSYSPAVSADGRSVAFVSKAGNLAARDRNDETDIYVYDVDAGSVELVSATSRGDAANAPSRRPSLSADGRYVVFESNASNLGAEPGCPRSASDTNLLPDVYVRDRVTRCIARLSGAAEHEWWTPSIAPAMAGSGHLVVFSSRQPAGDEDPGTDFDLFAAVQSTVPLNTRTIPSPTGADLSADSHSRSAR